MDVEDNAAHDICDPLNPARPVMTEEWAEAIIDLRRAQSRRRHPSSQPPTWEKDGGYEPMEWVV